MSNLTFRITGGTDVGLYRSNNEDNFIINADLSKSDWFIPSDTNLEIELSDVGSLFVVADGMGGMNAGEVASAIAIDTVKEMFTRDDFSSIIGSDQEIEQFMKSVIEVADEKIKAKVVEDSSTSGMGTTIVMAWVVDQKVHVAWCGDSRAYLFNTKSGLVRLSKDHSYVQQLVDEGKLDPELAFDHPDSNIITRSLGDSLSKAMPDYMSRKLSEGDIILLCSDGLCGLCRDEEIVDVLDGEYESIEQLKAQLIEKALAAGGYDNVTVALFQTVTAETVVADSMQLTTSDVGRDEDKPKKFAIKKWSIAAAILALVALGLILTNKDKESENPNPPTQELVGADKIDDKTADNVEPQSEPATTDDATAEKTQSADTVKQKGFIAWVKKLFTKKKAEEAPAVVDKESQHALTDGEPTKTDAAVENSAPSDESAVENLLKNKKDSIVTDDIKRDSLTQHVINTEVAETDENRETEKTSENKNQK